jgi:uncharacterized membrane protein
LIRRKQFFSLLTGVSLVAGALFATTLLAEPDQSPEKGAAGSAIGTFIAGEEKAKAGANETSTEDAIFQLPDVAALKALGDLDPEMRNAAIESMREYYRYRISGYQHRKAVFDWQLTSSKIIFWVVIVLVGVSIYFSGVQFHSALRSQRTAKPREGVQSAESSEMGAVPSDLQTSIEAGSGGIKVSSPVLGVIILVISLLFFYLYLVHIYPISEIW